MLQLQQLQQLGERRALSDHSAACNARKMGARTSIGDTSLHQLQQLQQQHAANKNATRRCSLPTSFYQAHHCRAPTGAALDAHPSNESLTAKIEKIKVSMDHMLDSLSPAPA